MVAARSTSWALRLGESIIARLVAYYIVLVSVVTVLWRLFPFIGQAWSAERLRQVNSDSFDLTGRQGIDTLRGLEGRLLDVDLVTAVLLSILGAVALALPVAWVYVATRQKKGYRQGIVQTLLILPIAISTVVLLVKSSVALAFSLAGIVAAIRFRNALDDTKDAVFMFVAIGIGLSAGVQLLTVAVVASIVFNAVMIAVWYFDFGREPAQLEGRRARRRLEQALVRTSPSGQFVSMLDQQILKSMSPDQLDALADRAWRRRKRNTPLDVDDDEKKPDFNALLCVQTNDVEGARRAAEGVLDNHAKRWQLAQVMRSDDGPSVVEFSVRLKKSSSPDSLIRDVRNHGGASVVSAVVK